MKTRTIVTTLSACMFVLAGDSSAKLANKPVHKPTAQTVVTTATPEEVQAEERVNKAKQNLETARKQLIAAKALLRASEADFQAAKAEKEALSLRTKAQGLADASGLKPQVINSQSAPIPTRQPADYSSTRIQQSDFTAEPIQ